jgi:CTP:molybdopterin cytidylyltransferase MocA
MDAAIVLAAGASTRLGQPKALVAIRGRPAIAHLCLTLREAGVDVVVVLGAEATRIAKAVPSFASVIVHTDWERGRSGTIKAGVRHVPASAAVLVCPVDHPAIATTTLRALRAARGSVRIPTHEGRRGHPTWFAASLRAELLALRDDEPLSDVVHRDPSRVIEVAVDDPGVLLNVDTPDDLKKLARHLERSSHARPPA